jgi:hypothetical protein
MKTEDLLLLGIAGFAIYYFFFKKDGLADWGSGGGGGGGGGGGMPPVPQNPPPTAPPAAPPYLPPFTPGGVGAYGKTYIAPPSTKAAVVQALQGGATVYLHKQALGKRVDVIAIPKTGKLAALLTVGSPAKQIQKYATAPRIFKGKKVM